MKRMIGRLKLGVALVGIAVGAGAILLAPSVGITGNDTEHRTEDRVCVSGCDPQTQFCCVDGGE